MKFFGLIFFPVFVAAVFQSSSTMDMHGIRPGMVTREIILHAQAKLDTTVWGGADAHNTIEFKGEYLSDSGMFRVYVVGPDVNQVTFITKLRTVADNTKAFNREMDAIKKLYGAPSQDYHNKYRIVSWGSGGLQLNLTTADSGKFYSVTLSKPLVKTGPAK